MLHKHCTVFFGKFYCSLFFLSNFSLITIWDLKLFRIVLLTWHWVYHLSPSIKKFSYEIKVFLLEKLFLMHVFTLLFIFLWDCYMSVTFCCMYLEIWPVELHSFWSFQRIDVLNTFIDSFYFTLINVAFRGKLFMGKLFLSTFHILCSHVWLRENICTQRACVIFFLNTKFILNQPFEVSIVLLNKFGSMMFFMFYEISYKKMCIFHVYLNAYVKCYNKKRKAFSRIFF